MKNSPCYGCTDRGLWCHTYCEKYKKFVEENNKVLEQRKKEYEEKAFFYGIKARRDARIAAKSKKYRNRITAEE